MATKTWDPFRELESLRREFDRIFGDYAGNGGSPYARAAFLPGRAARLYPMVNMREDRDHLYLEALAPGLDPGSVELTVHNNTLRIQGEKQAISADIKPEQWHRSERSAGRFVRTLSLPVDVDSENVKAEYRNGLLHITLPKSEKAKPKQISVEVK
jgi:HSP20 family protein